MLISVPREVAAGERRVALVPDAVARLMQEGLKIQVETGAGDAAYFTDRAYAEAGATIVSDEDSIWGVAEILVKVAPPAERDGTHEVEWLREGTILIGFLNPLGNPELIERLAERKVTGISMELIPRISRAQSMDALSSQAAVAGYKAVLLAAERLPKFFPMLTTAAGTMRPARVLVIGAGVAGLQAVATARRLGAEVEGFDIRPAAKEEVESLGAKFVQVELKDETEAEGGYAREVSEAAREREQEVLAEHIGRSDVVITAAQVPGRRAPVLVTEGMVASMSPGAIIMDLAADQGGNCALTEAGKEAVKNGVTIMGPLNLPATMPVHASQMYARNISSLLRHLLKEGALHLDFDDEILDAACVTHEGAIRNEMVRAALAGGSLGQPTTERRG